MHTRIKKTPLRVFFLFVAAHIENNSNEFIAQIINIAENLTDTDIALYNAHVPESTEPPTIPVVYIP